MPTTRKCRHKMLKLVGSLQPANAVQGMRWFLHAEIWHLWRVRVTCFPRRGAGHLCWGLQPSSPQDVCVEERHYWDARPLLLKRKLDPSFRFCKFVNTTPTIDVPWKDRLPTGWVQKKAENTRSQFPKDSQNPALIYVHRDKHRGQLGPIDYVLGSTSRTEILRDSSQARGDRWRPAIQEGLPGLWN